MIGVHGTVDWPWVVMAGRRLLGREVFWEGEVAVVWGKGVEVLYMIGDFSPEGGEY